MPGLPQSLDTDATRGPDVQLGDAPVVERLPEPRLGRQLEATAHEVPDHVAMADQDVDRSFGYLDGGGQVALLLLLLVPLLSLQFQFARRVGAADVVSEGTLNSGSLLEKCLKHVN